jgi:hypothetical protein
MQLRTLLFKNSLWITLMVLAVLSTSEAHAETFVFVSSASAHSICAQFDQEAKAALVKKAEGELGRDFHPIKTVHLEGTLPSQPGWAVGIAAHREWNIILDLGLAYCASGDPRFAQRAAAGLAAWVAVYQPSFNPIDESELDPLFMTFDLIRDTAPQELRKKWNIFSSNLAIGYIDQAEANFTRDFTNWQSHRVKIATAAAFEIGDQELVRRAKSVLLSQSTHTVTEDGSVVDFHLRDALHYTVYDLQPLVQTMLMAQAHGQDWNRNAAPPGIDGALEWLLPYATGKLRHEEFVNSKGRFDRARALAGMKAYSGAWDPAGSRDLYFLAGGLTQKWTRVAYDIGFGDSLYLELMRHTPKNAAAEP